jgi:hypothetical protein
MKRTTIFLIALALSATPAVAAPKSITVKKLTSVAISHKAEFLVTSGKSIITIGNSDGINSNILLTGVDPNGVVLWQKSIDSGVDEVALAATTDTAGNIWLAGASSMKVSAESSTVTVVADNPDGVISEPISQLRNDMNQLTIWKVSSSGEIISTFSSNPLSAPPLVNALSANSTGISIVGSILEKPFVQNVTAQGTFGKISSIGSSQTSLNAIVRHADGSASIFGASSETLGGKKLAGRRDGVLIKVSKSGQITSVVRSSAPKTDRSWISANSSLALTGYLKTGNRIETAFTKFTSAFVPTWTLRVPSLGTSLVTSSGSNTFGALTSQSSITGIVGWKPSTPSLLLLSFDQKGVIAAAYGSSEMTEPLALTYSKDLGIIGLARTSAQSLALFRAP